MQDVIETIRKQRDALDLALKVFEAQALTNGGAGATVKAIRRKPGRPSAAVSSAEGGDGRSKRGAVKQAVIDCLLNSKGPMKPAAVGAVIGKPYVQVNAILNKLEGTVTKRAEDGWVLRNSYKKTLATAAKAPVEDDDDDDEPEAEAPKKKVLKKKLKKVTVPAEEPEADDEEPEETVDVADEDDDDEPSEA